MKGELSVPDEPVAAAALLFGEAPSRIIVSLEPGMWPDLHQMAASMGVPLTQLGTAGGDRLSLGDGLDLPVALLHSAWQDGLQKALLSVRQPQSTQEESASE
jgi:phosphoribosylformylglycinamidine synthase